MQLILRSPQVLRLVSYIVEKFNINPAVLRHFSIRPGPGGMWARLEYFQFKRIQYMHYVKDFYSESTQLLQVFLLAAPH